MMATYQKWDQSYTPKVTTIRLSYRGVKYNKVCATKQSVHQIVLIKALIKLFGKNIQLKKNGNYHIFKKCNMIKLC